MFTLHKNNFNGQAILGCQIKVLSIFHFLKDKKIRSFNTSFDNVNQEWLMKFLEHRIADTRIPRMVKRFLKAGVSEDRTRLNPSFIRFSPKLINKPSRHPVKRR